MKTILSLLLLFPLVVLADNASAPTAPTIPTMLTDTPNETAIKNDATSNQVYIDQAGENINANINQTGQGNKLGLGTGNDAFKLDGDNQTITTVQTGNNNTIKGGIVSGTGSNEQAIATIQQIGDSNFIDIECGTGQFAPCSKLNFNARFTGNSNSLNYNGAASEITTAIDVTGNQNLLNMDILSNRNSQVLAITGNQNTLNIKQEGGALNGHSLDVALVGSGNSITAYQGGPVDTLINLNSVGNNGTFNFNVHY